MKYRILSSILFCATTSAETYKSIANEVVIDDQSQVAVSLLKIDNDDELNCTDSGILFNLEQQYSKVWLDSIVLSRQSQQLLEFTYEESSCQLTSLKLLPIFVNGDGSSIGSGPLKETGLNGNVALIGSNGITNESITGGDYYNTDEPAAAFDGYIYTQQVNDESEAKIERGIWLVRDWNDPDQPSKPWVQVDFGIVAELSGVGLFLNPQSLGLGRLPRYMSVYTSENGEDFELAYETTLSNQEANTLQFPSSIQGRFFKLEFNYNFGDNNYIEVDEIEFYQ